MTDARWAAVVAAAASPEARLGPAFEPVGAPDRAATVAARRARWAEAAAGGDGPAFDALVAGLDVERALGPARLRPGAPLPSWASFLRDALATPSPAPPHAADLPFADALAPFVAEASARLAATAGDALPASLRADAERDLAAILSVRVAQALTHEFGLFRLGRQSVADRLAPRPGDSALYDAFTAHLRAGDWLPLFEAYPALAPLVGRAALDGVERWAELAARALADRPALETAFGPLGPPVGAWAMATDRHEAGRTVVGVAFESGARVVYKPRPLGLEAAFYDLLGWLSVRDPAFDLDVPQVRDRGAYGWMAFVDAAPCAGGPARGRFYRRVGALLAVAYALDAGDLHMENLLAAGEHPVLVDVETAMSPTPRLEGAGPARRSVLTTGILPRAGADEDTSALTGGAARVFEGVPTWRGVNTDRMALVAGEAARGALGNRPTAEAEPVEGEAVADGFAAGYRALARLRGELLASPAWAAFRGHRVRYLPRSTATYVTVLMRSLRPEALLDGADRWVALDVLSRPVAGPEETRDLEPLVAAERRTLWAGYVPTATARTDGTALHLGDGATLPDFFEETGMARAERALRSLSETDLEVQLETIRHALPPGPVR